MRHRTTAPARVTNINKDGEPFDPAAYTVRRADNPGVYAFLEKREKHGNHNQTLTPHDAVL